MRLFAKNLLFTIVVPGTVAVYVPLWIARYDRGATPVLAWAVATPLFALGVAVYLWCVWCFATVGRGTPAPIDAPRRLVVVGPYRHVRNPMYLGVLLVVVGWTTLFRSIGLAAYAALVALAFHLFVVIYEEPKLNRSLGTDYGDYRRLVWRWLPRLRIDDR